MINDLIIIGGGPAGYLAAERAGNSGLKTLLIEKNQLGGVCLNEGCIPTKTLLYSAKLKDGAQFGENYGVISRDIYIDHEKVIQRKDKVVKTLIDGIGMALKAANVDIINSYATIKGKNTEGLEIAAGRKTYVCKNVLIATGSNPAVPPIPGLREALESGFALTNKEILELIEVPEKLVVIGGGVIGMEMASYFHSAGCQVTVIEMQENIGGSIDKEIASILRRNYEKKGINICLGARVVEIQKGSLKYTKDDKIQTIEVDRVLLSIGRRPNIENVGLGNIGVKSKDGAIQTDKRMHTNVRCVFAAGDVTGKSMLAHTAYREAEVAVNNILGNDDVMQYSAIPSVIYTNPEVAGVGLTDIEAREQGLDISVKKLSMNYSGRYMAENNRGDGIIKVIVDNVSNHIIGVHMIGSYASEIIQNAAILIQNKISIEDIKKTVFAHPTVGEILREAIWQL